MMPARVDGSAFVAEPGQPNPAAVAAADSIAASIAPGPTDRPARVGPPVEPEKPATDEPTEATAEVDGGGTPFDADRHLHKRHPRTGRWMPRRRPATGNGHESTETATGSVVGYDEPAAAEPSAPAPPSEHDVCVVMAELHCRAFYGVAVAFLSDEWLAAKDEHRTNVETLAAYYRASNIRPDSPVIALLAQAVAFGGKRLALPKTQTRLGMLSGWIRQKISSWRGARRAAALRSVGS